MSQNRSNAIPSESPELTTKRAELELLEQARRLRAAELDAIIERLATVRAEISRMEDAARAPAAPPPAAPRVAPYHERAPSSERSGGGRRYSSKPAPKICDTCGRPHASDGKVRCIFGVARDLGVSGRDAASSVIRDVDVDHLSEQEADVIIDALKARLGQSRRAA